MPLLPRLHSLWRTLFRKDRLDRELDEELRAALDTLIERHRERGLDAAAARRAALAALGDVEDVKSDAWGPGWTRSSTTCATPGTAWSTRPASPP
jgi:hypothetical protein